MGLPDAAIVSLRKDNIRLVILWHLHWREPRMDTIYFFPIDFFRDFSVLPAISPPEIVFISLAGGLLSLAP